MVCVAYSGADNRSARYYRAAGRGWQSGTYIRAARPETAIPLYEDLIDEFKKVLGGKKVQTGIFGADMQVYLVNDGPVTIILDSKNKE